MHTYTHKYTKENLKKKFYLKKKFQCGNQPPLQLKIQWLEILDFIVKSVTAFIFQVLTYLYISISALSLTICVTLGKVLTFLSISFVKWHISHTTALKLVCHAASPMEGLFCSPAPGHCQSPFSWWSITLVGNSSMSVSSNKFKKHFSKLSPLQKIIMLTSTVSWQELTLYTRKRPTHHSSQ